MATTVQAWGKILDARSRDVEIPDTWAVDEKGQPTTDPYEVRGLLPISGPKGYGLMMMVDVLGWFVVRLTFWQTCQLHVCGFNGETESGSDVFSH